MRAIVSVRTKEFSLSGHVEEIRGAFREQFPNDNNQDGTVYVQDVYIDYVVVESEGKLFRVDFVRTNNMFMFSTQKDWIEVKKVFVPVMLESSNSEIDVS